MLLLCGFLYIISAPAAGLRPIFLRLLEPLYIHSLATPHNFYDMYTKSRIFYSFERNISSLDQKFAEEKTPPAGNHSPHGRRIITSFLTSRTLTLKNDCKMKSQTWDFAAVGGFRQNEHALYRQCSSLHMRILAPTGTISVRLSGDGRPITTYGVRNQLKYRFHNPLDLIGLVGLIVGYAVLQKRHNSTHLCLPSNLWRSVKGGGAYR